MCYQVIEKYAECGCIYHIHRADPCSLAKQPGHLVRKRETQVGYACTRHSIRGAQPSANAKASQQNNGIKQPQYDPPGKPKLLERLEPKLSTNFRNLCDDSEDRSLQTAIAAYETRETYINKALEAIVAPSAAKHGNHDANDSAAPSCSSSIFDGASASSSVSSRSSLERPPDFSEELLSALANNITLVPLFRLVLKCNTDQFVKAFTALLRLYSEDLGQVSSSPLEKSASLVIRARSRYIASHLDEYFIACNPKEICRQPMIQQVGLRAQYTDDFGDGNNHDAFGIPHLAQLKLDQVKRFLFDDVPFLKLRERLEKLAGEVSNPNNSVFTAPMPSISNHHNTRKQSDNLTTSGISASRCGQLGMISPRRMVSVKQKTSATKQSRKQTKEAPVFPDGTSSPARRSGVRPTSQLLTTHKLPEPETESLPNDVPKLKSIPSATRSKEEEEITASEISIKADTDFIPVMVEAPDPHKKANRTFIQITILIILIKRLGRRKHVENSDKIQDIGSTTSEPSRTLGGFNASFPIEDRTLKYVQQSSCSQMAESKLRYQTKDHLYDERSPLLDEDQRVQELSWVCVSRLMPTY